jgi:hypothetical protein
MAGARLDSLSIVNRIYQDSADHIEAITRLVIKEEVLGETDQRLLDFDPSSARRLSHLSKRTQAALLNAETKIRKARTFWGRLMLRLQHPFLGLQALGRRVQLEQLSLESAIKTVEAENIQLKTLDTQVIQANQLVEEELSYLHTISDLLLVQAQSLREKDPVRTTLETEIVPSIQSFTPYVMEVSSQVSAINHQLNAALHTNNQALIEANAVKLGALPVFMAKNAAKIGLVATRSSEQRSSNFDSAEAFTQFCVNSGPCAGIRVLTFEDFKGADFYRIRWVYGRVHSVLPNGNIVVAAEGYTSQHIIRQIHEIALTSPSIKVMGFSVGDTVAHKTKDLFGVISGIRADGTAVVQTKVGQSYKVIPLSELVAH